MMPSVVQRALLQQDESIDPLDLLDKMDMATADRQAATRVLRQTAKNEVLVNLPTTLSPQQCARLRNFVQNKIKDDGIDNVDACPDWQVNIHESKLAKLIGAHAMNKIFALPAQLSNHNRDEGDDTVPTTSDDFSRVGIFLRMYQPSKRPWMPFHADGNAFTVNIALNDDQEFTGGRLMALYNGGLQALERQAGDATCHKGSVYHAVSAIRSGTRYSLIVFLHQ